MRGRGERNIQYKWSQEFASPINILKAKNLLVLLIYLKSNDPKFLVNIFSSLIHNGI